MNLRMQIWFATQIDIDHKNSYYDDEIRLYSSNFNEEYKLITGVSFDNNILKVKDYDGYIIELENEPDNKKFENTLFRDWERWDSVFGSSYDDRTVYEPWAYDSVKTLAIDLGVHNIDENEYDIQMFYKKYI